MRRLLVAFLIGLAGGGVFAVGLFLGGASSGQALLVGGLGFFVFALIGLFIGGPVPKRHDNPPGWSHSQNSKGIWP